MYSKFDVPKKSMRLTIWHWGSSVLFAMLLTCPSASFRFEPPALGVLFKCDTVVSEKPVQFTKVTQIDRKGLDEIFFWYPVPPLGYASLGCIVTKTDEMPSKDSICCPKLSLVSQANISEDPTSKSSNSKGPYCWSIWKVENQVVHHSQTISSKYYFTSWHWVNIGIKIFFLL